MATGILVLAPGLRAQPAGASGGEFRVPFFSQGRQTALLTGQGAVIQADGSILLRTARVENQDAGGNTNANVIVLATNCVADLKRNVVWSADGLGLRTADGQFVLAGVGFAWWQTNNELVVSNQVRTDVRKHAASPGRAVTLSIRSDLFRLNYATNIVTFLGGVRAEDPEMNVDAGQLTVRRSATGKFDHILAGQDVRITSRRDGSVTSSDRAEYTLADSGELMELTGSPRWRDALREARADRFVLQRTPNDEPHFLRAIGNAWIKLPAGTNSLTAWPLVPSPAPRPAGGNEDAPNPGPMPEALGGATAPSRSLELTASSITIVLPPTNGPVQGLVAETDVAILAVADGWKATAQLAVLTNSVLELSGTPVWTQGDRSVRGEVLRLDTRDRSFAADGRAHIRFPAAAFGAALPGLGEPSTSAFVVRSNHFVVVESERAEFRAGALRFASPVKAQLTESNLPLGQITCRDLTVTYRERLEHLEAEGDVRLEQFSRPGRPHLTRLIECEQLRVEFDETGRVRGLSADGGVNGRQNELPPDAAAPLLTVLQADHLDARFLLHTNQLELAIAEGHVRIEREQRVAEGERAEFAGTNGVLTLIGQPLVTTPEGSIRDASALTWNTRTRKVRGQGPFRIEWLRAPTNAPSLRPARNQPE